MSTSQKNISGTILGLLAVAGFLLTLIPSFLNWQGILDPEKVNPLMLVGTIVWFASASFVLGKKQTENTDEK